MGIAQPSRLSKSILKAASSPSDHNLVTFAKESFRQTLLGFGDGYTSNVNDVTNVSSQIPAGASLLGVYLRKLKIETCRIISWHNISFREHTTNSILCSAQLSKTYLEFRLLSHRISFFESFRDNGRKTV